jgi:hypothetical protein
MYRKWLLLLNMQNCELLTQYSELNLWHRLKWVYRVSLTPVCSLSNAKDWTQRSSARRQVTTKQWKIKPPVCSIKHPQSIVGCGGTAPSFNQTMDGCEWSALRPGYIYPRERASRYSLNNMQNEPQSWSGSFRHKYLAPIEKRTLIPRSPSP